MSLRTYVIAGGRSSRKEKARGRCAWSRRTKRVKAKAMGVRRVSKKLGWRGDKRGLKAKARRGMCSKTEVVGAYGICCDDGALLREGAVGAQQQLIVKASLCCWCATPTPDPDVRRDVRAQMAGHAWKTVDLHLKMLLHLKLACSEMLTGLPAVKELETGSEWSCRGRKLLVLARKLAVVLEGLSTWRFKSRREVEGRREELLWVEERRVGAVGSVVYIPPPPGLGDAKDRITVGRR
jgi:hypothetical protein